MVFGLLTDSTDKPVFGTPADSKSTGATGLGESALGGGGLLSRSTSSLATKGSLYYLTRFVVVLKSCSVLRRLARPNLLKPVRPYDLPVLLILFAVD